MIKEIFERNFSRSIFQDHHVKIIVVSLNEINSFFYIIWFLKIKFYKY